MQRLTFSNLTFDHLANLVDLQEQEGIHHPWTIVDQINLTESDRHCLQDIHNRIQGEPLHLLNEATLWARAIYPLLVLAEQDNIRAWGEVPLKAAYAQFELEGIVDGLLGKSIGGRIKAPYLVVVETKRGIEAQNPLAQLYGQLLAAAKINWQQDHQDPQEMFGCYTIADSWTFVKGLVQALESDRPRLTVESSQEYAEKVDAEIILKLLKAIVKNSNSRCKKN